MFQRSLVLYTCVILLLGLTQLCLAVSIQGYEPVGDDGWLRLHPTPATWLAARIRCEVEGGTLASPTSSALTSNMKSKMAAIDSVFTGMHANSTRGDIDDSPPPAALLFLYLGVPLSSVAAPWARGEPSSLADDKDCKAMNKTGELADVSCAGELPFFCYKSKAAMAESACGTNNGYTLEPRTGSCYKFYRTGISWHRANMKCNSEGAHLAVINSWTEVQVIKALYARNPDSTILTRSYKNAAHIGFFDLDKKGHWLTIFGETLSEAGYSYWESGEPNNQNHDEYCGAITRNGRLNDDSCVDTDNPYICEITPKNIIY